MTSPVKPLAILSRVRRQLIYRPDFWTEQDIREAYVMVGAAEDAVLAEARDACPEVNAAVWADLDEMVREVAGREQRSNLL